MLKQLFEFRSQEGWRHVGERVADAVVRIVASLLVLGVFTGLCFSSFQLVASARCWREGTDGARRENGLLVGESALRLRIPPRSGVLR